jgi:hypothetical protein
VTSAREDLAHRRALLEGGGGDSGDEGSDGDEDGGETHSVDERERVNGLGGGRGWACWTDMRTMSPSYIPQGGRSDLSSGASIATEESLHQREASSPAGDQGLASHCSTRLPGGGGR